MRNGKQELEDLADVSSFPVHADYSRHGSTQLTIRGAESCARTADCSIQEGVASSVIHHFVYAFLFPFPLSVTFLELYHFQSLGLSSLSQIDLWGA